MTNYDYYIYNTLIQIRDILQLGFGKEIHEENLRLAELKVSAGNFVKQILDYTDELISEGELKQSQKHVGTRVSSCLTRAGITSFEEYDKWTIADLMTIRNFGGRTLEAAIKIRAWHERMESAKKDLETWNPNKGLETWNPNKPVTGYETHTAYQEAMRKEKETG